MAIYKGDKEIVGLYKGPTEIIKRYKGSNLIYNVFKWLPYSYEYIYNSLVPSVINNKNVKDKAQVVKVYGNSEVKNQLIDTGRYYGTELTITWLNNGKFKVSGTTTETNTIYFGSTSLPIGTIGLLMVSKKGASGTFKYRGGGWSRETTDVVSQTATTNKFIIAIDFYANNTFNDEEFEINFVNLTQWFPFNTPTSLTDTRVQEIINRGHIPYNAGTLKNVNIGEISSEPYNLFDGELQQGYYDTTTEPIIINNANNYICSKEKFRVVAGQTYTLETDDDIFALGLNAIYIGFADENGKHISWNNNSISKTITFTIPNNAYWCYFEYFKSSGISIPSLNKCCFHLTGSRTGYAPIKTFNLWNEETILALLQYDKTAGDFGQQISGSNITSKNYISVLPNNEYSVSGATAQANMVLFCYDENKNAIIVGDKGYIAIKSNGQTFTTPNDCRYVRFYMSNPYGATYNHDICINVSGSKNGTYLPYGVADRLSLPYQGSGVGTAHDTLEITDTEYVFTKNMVDVDLGVQNFVQKDNGSWHFTAVEHSHNYNYTDLTNIVCSIGEQKSAFVLEQKTQTELEAYGTFLYGYGGSYNGFRIFRSDLANKTVEEVQAAMAGISLKYELANPQVIRIPKKHLRVVDLGSLNGYISNDKYFISSEYLGINTMSSNDNGYACYCKDYLIDSGYNVYNKTKNKTMCLTSPFIGNNFIIWDSSFIGKTAEEIKALLSGTYLFYETEDEVADIISDINIEAGGSVTTNWFSWVENQNALPLTSNKWVSASAYGTLTDATATSVLYTRNQTDYTGNVPLMFQAIKDGYGSIAGHKYLIKCTITPSASFKFRAYIGTYGNVYNPVANAKNYFVEIITANSNGYLQFISENGGHLPLGGTVLFENVQCIDLTLGFGEGKEPTSINDPRIQYILKHGYIPTNTTGTNKSVASEVLPNIDFKIKCK